MNTASRYILKCFMAYSNSFNILIILIETQFILAAACYSIVVNMHVHVAWKANEMFCDRNNEYCQTLP